MRINESGRSMIEMLGVLAIIGVLSVGGIAGYSKAMAKFRVNKTIDQVSHIVANTRILFGAQRNYKDLEKCGAQTKAGRGLIYKSKLMPDGMIALKENSTDDYTLTNAYVGNMDFCSGDRLVTGDYKAFVLVFPAIPQDACIDLATQDWNAASGSGLVAIEVASDNTAAKGKLETFTALTSTGCLSKTNGAGDAFVCSSGTKAEPMKVIDATNACTGDLNTIYFKFY